MNAKAVARVPIVDHRGDIRHVELRLVARGRNDALIAVHPDLGEVVLAEGEKAQEEMQARIARIERENKERAADAMRRLKVALGLDDDALAAFLARCTREQVGLRRGWVVNTQGVPDLLVPRCETPEQAAIVIARMIAPTGNVPDLL